VEFNKLGPQGGTGSYDFYFQGDYLGVDRVGEVADLAVKYQVIQKSGAWLKYNEEQFHGRDKFAEKLRYDEAFMSEIEGKLIERI
jgi:recombination protein RecA